MSLLVEVYHPLRVSAHPTMMCAPLMCGRQAALLAAVSILWFSSLDADAFSPALSPFGGCSLKNAAQSSGGTSLSPFGACSLKDAAQSGGVTALSPFGGCSLKNAAQSSTVLSMAAASKPRGSAATPLDKKSIAVFGAGGYTGGTIFGYLQRASISMEQESAALPCRGIYALARKGRCG